jgi:cobalt/nickel transport system permease protein
VNASSLIVRHTSPAARLLCSAIVVVGLATAPRRLSSGLASLALVLFVLWAASVAWRRLLWRGLVLALTSSALLVPLAVTGRAADALFSGARVLCAGVAALGFAATLPVAELAAALGALRVPRSLTGTIEIMLRQLVELEREGRRIALALALRGARGRVLATSTAGALFVRSIERAERVDLAMRLRGYDPGSPAPSARLRAADAPALCVALACALSVHVVAQLV